MANSHQGETARPVAWLVEDWDGKKHLFLTLDEADKYAWDHSGGCTPLYAYAAPLPHPPVAEAAQKKEDVMEQAELAAARYVLNTTIVPPAKDARTALGVGTEAVTLPRELTPEMVHAICELEQQLQGKHCQGCPKAVDTQYGPAYNGCWMIQKERYEAMLSAAAQSHNASDVRALPTGEPKAVEDEQETPREWAERTRDRLGAMMDKMQAKIDAATPQPSAPPAQDQGELGARKSLDGGTEA